MRYSIALIGMLVLPTALAAQHDALAAGTRIRVTAPSRGFTGTVGSLLQVHGDTLVVEHVSSAMQRGRVIRSPDTTRVLARDVTRLEVSVGRRSNISKGVRTGVMVGGAIGALLGAGAAGDGDDFLCSGPGCVALGAGGGAFYGAIFGLIIGAFSTRDDWRPVLAPSSAGAASRVALVPLPDGRFAMAATIGF